MNLYNNQLNQAFQSGLVLKVITGINNTNINQVVKVAKAAALSKATYLDVAANVKLVKALKSISSLPICVGSINPIDIYNCVLSGADLIEIGNYDFFYKQGIYLTLDQILDLTLEVKSLVGDIDICVTIPYYANLLEQVYLAKKLEFIGVNIIQTEGISKLNIIKKVDFNKSIDLLNLDNTFLPSLLSTYLISETVSIPVIASSGCKNILGQMSEVYGASGIGIGSSIEKQDTITSILKYIDQAYESMVSISQLKRNHCSDIMIC